MPVKCNSGFGALQPSSNLASALVLIHKDGEMNWCIDYRHSQCEINRAATRLSRRTAGFSVSGCHCAWKMLQLFVSASWTLSSVIRLQVLLALIRMTQHFRHYRWVATLWLELTMTVLRGCFVLSRLMVSSPGDCENSVVWTWSPVITVNACMPTQSHSRFVLGPALLKWGRKLRSLLLLHSFPMYLTRSCLSHGALTRRLVTGLFAAEGAS